MKKKTALCISVFNSLLTSCKCVFTQPSLCLILSFNKQASLSASITPLLWLFLLLSLPGSPVMGDYIERPVERETNRVVCQRPDREGPSNGRPFKAKKEKLIMIKGL